MHGFVQNDSFRSNVAQYLPLRSEIFWAKMCDEAAGTAALRAGRCTAYSRLFSLIPGVVPPWAPLHVRNGFFGEMRGKRKPIGWVGRPGYAPEFEV
jgi:hypothetical protein